MTLTDFLTEKCSSASKFWRITVDVCNPASRTRSRKTNHLQGNHGNSSVLRGQLTFLFFYLPRLSEHSAAATWNILGNFDEVCKGGEEQIPCGPKWPAVLQKAAEHLEQKSSTVSTAEGRPFKNKRVKWLSPAGNSFC